MKRMFSILLAACFLAGLGIPTMAAGEADVDSYAPIFIGSGHNLAIIGRRFNTEALVRLPAGTGGTLSVAWYLDDKLVATGTKLDIRVTEDMYPRVTFRVVATNTYVDQDGQTQTASAEKYISENIEKPAPWYEYLFYGFILVLAAPFYAIFAWLYSL